MLFERINDLPVVVEPQVGSLIRRNRLQEEDRNDEAICLLVFEPFCHHAQDFRLPNATWSTEQDMRGIGMLFHPQGQLVINTRQVRVFHGNSLKSIQPCSVLWCQLCHASDTPLTSEGWSDRVP